METALLVAGSTPTFWIPQFFSTSSYSSVQALGCSHNCRRLTYSSFQLTHMLRDDLAVQLIEPHEPWRPRRRRNIITALTTLPQRWVSRRKHQYTTAITTMWTESSWAFPESYTADESWIVHALERLRTTGDKRAHNSTTKVSCCKIIVRLSDCMIAITRV